jgi:CMP-N,N'-diacetyllegionaminic acid synthase
MYKNKRILALIPARGGSKGLPGKNVRPLLGKPLVAWSIEQALSSKYIDKVVVSTESPIIASIARRYGADVPFLRPKKLATGKAKTIDVIFHVVDYFNKRKENFDYLVLLEPTSPLRGTSDLDNAIKKLIDKSRISDALVSVGEIRLESPYIAKSIVNGYVTPLIKENTKKFFQRQQLPKTFFPYGVIYASKVESLKKKKTFYHQRTIPHFIERWQNYEVDDIYDFVCIEAILRERVGKK